MRRSSFWLLTSLAVLAAAPALGEPPSKLEMAFEVRRGGSAVADVVHRLQHDGKTYDLRETWSGRGMYALLGRAERSSRGMVAPEGLRPIEYVDARTGRRPERASFDWAGQRVRLEHRGEMRSLVLPPGATDRLALMYEFAFDAPGAAPVALHVVDGRRISGQTFRPEGTERLATPAGEFQALKYVRRKSKGERAEIWLARDRALIPLRILVVDDDGSELDQIVTRISGF